MDISSKQKINKETQVLNDTLDEMDRIDIFRTYHPNEEEYTFFSSAHGSFSRTDILGHKPNLSISNKIETVSSIFFDCNSCLWDELSITRKQTVRNTETWRLNNPFLNDQRVTEEIKREIKTSRNKGQWKQDHSKSVRCSKSSSKREVYRNTILTQETRKTSNRQTNFTPKITGKKEQKTFNIDRS